MREGMPLFQEVTMTNDEGHGLSDTPPSFAPKPRRKAAAQDAQAQPAPPAFAPHSRRSSSGASATQPSPASIPPRAARDRTPRDRTPRATAGTTIGHAATQHPQQAASKASTAAATTPHPSAARPHTTHHRVRNSLIAALVIVLVAALCAGFGIWNWVSGSLRKEDWLTGKTAGPATTWLILGSDERDGTTGSDDTPGDRTDTILILTKPKHGPSSLISVPRDSLVQVDDALLKINAVMQIYGRQELVAQIEDITGQKVDHVAKITFGGLTGVVDALGGIELCYDQDVDDELSDLHWKAGCHVVDGHTALAFSRMRYSDPKGDFGRAERQRQVIGAIAKKAASPSTLMNFGTVHKVGDAVLQAITVDNRTNPKTLLDMLLAFRNASGSSGVTGSLYWSDPNYYVDGVGSCVLLDNPRNLELFAQLADGTHDPGAVGSAAEMG